MSFLLWIGSAAEGVDQGHHLLCACCGDVRVLSNISRSPVSGCAKSYSYKRESARNSLIYAQSLSISNW